MTQAIFEEWITDSNRMMKKENRKILLLADNATSHRGTTVMSNVTVKFLPLNLTSEVQPLDQGITRSVKVRYRKMMLQYTVTVAEPSNTRYDFNKSISALHAVRSVSSAWEQISRETTAKCFRRAGFNYHEEECDEDTQLNKVIRSLPLDAQKELVYVDEMESGDADLIKHEEVPSTPDEVLEEIFQKMEEQPTIEELNCENGDSDDNDDTVSTEHVRPLPTHKDALQCVSQLITYSTNLNSWVIFFTYNSIEA
jgi:hypothetical protein